MDVKNYPAPETAIDIQAAVSDTMLPNIGENGDDSSLINDPFLITSSLPNIIDSSHHIDPLRDIIEKKKASSNSKGSTGNNVLGELSIDSENVLEVEFDAPEEELECLVDDNNSLQIGNRMTDDSSVTQMMIYPRANTPQPDREKQLPTIVISDSAKLQPSSRRSSFVSVKSINIGNENEFAPRLADESTPNVCLETSETESEIRFDISLDTSTCTPGCENDTILVTDSESSKPNQSLQIKNDPLVKRSNEISDEGKMLLHSSSLSKSMLSLKVLDYTQASNNSDQIKSISQFSTLSKSCVSLHLVNELTNNSLFKSRPVMYTSALSYSNIAINLVGQDSDKNGCLDENENSVQVELAGSKEKILPNKSLLDKKSDPSKKVWRTLLPTNLFGLDLTYFGRQNKSSSSNSINYYSVENLTSKHCISKMNKIIGVPSPTNENSSQMYLEQYGYPKENIFDGCKCSVM